MKPPPFFLAAALLFWGWQTGLVKFAALMAVILESPRLTKLRWDFSDDDFARLWTFCTLLFLGTAVYAFTANEGPSHLLHFLANQSISNATSAGNASALAAAAFFRWLPMTFFLFIAAQVYSTRDEIPLSTISLIMRLRWKRAVKLGRPLPAVRGVNISYPYFAICLFSASIHEPSMNTLYFWGLCALIAWALWTQRSRRFRIWTWSVALAVAITLGYFGQQGLAQFAGYLGRLNPNLFTLSARGRTNPTRSTTSFGKIGNLKLSGAIVIRLEPMNSPPPQYLREATYRLYAPTNSWVAGRSSDDFEPVAHDTNVWKLVPGKPNMFRARISSYLEPSGDVLAIPEDCGQLEDLAAWTMTKNSAGTIKLEAPGLVIFDALYGPGPRVDSKPDDQDHVIPDTEEPALKQVAEQLNVAGQDFDMKLRAVNAFFQSNFTYTTWLQSPRMRRNTNETAIARFLLNTKRGHCEYFATAAALLLRELGIPTRYAVGYAVHEKSGKGYVVRGRDAHAWCLVYNSKRGSWQDFDVTPASWVEEESKFQSSLQWISDAWSWVKFQFSKFRWGQTHLRVYVLAVLVPVLLLLLIQIFFRRKRLNHGSTSSGADSKVWPGLDSEFYRIEKKLATKGISRPPNEPLSDWLERATKESSLIAVRPTLKKLLQLHYRCRFDPRGLTTQDRQALKQGTDEVLESLARN
jgi:hypothetical protein